MPLLQLGRSFVLNSRIPCARASFLPRDCDHLRGASGEHRCSERSHSAQGKSNLFVATPLSINNLRKPGSLTIRTLPSASPMFPPLLCLGLAQVTVLFVQTPCSLRLTRMPS